MTPYDFLAVLEQDLRLRGEAFDRDELRVWVSTMWPLIIEDPDPVRWVGEFLDRLRGVLPTVLTSNHRNGAAGTPSPA
jgi:hypothetical protein